MNYYFVDISDIHGNARFVGGAPTLGGAKEAAKKHSDRVFRAEVSEWSGIGPWFSSPIGVEKTYRIYFKEVSSR